MRDIVQTLLTIGIIALIIMFTLKGNGGGKKGNGGNNSNNSGGTE